MANIIHDSMEFQIIKHLTLSSRHKILVPLVLLNLTKKKLKTSGGYDSTFFRTLHERTDCPVFSIDDAVKQIKRMKLQEIKADDKNTTSIMFQREMDEFFLMHLPEDILDLAKNEDVVDSLDRKKMHAKSTYQIHDSEQVGINSSGTYHDVKKSKIGPTGKYLPPMKTTNVMESYENGESQRPIIPPKNEHVAKFENRIKKKRSTINAQMHGNELRDRENERRNTATMNGNGEYSSDDNNDVERIVQKRRSSVKNSGFANDQDIQEADTDMKMVHRGSDGNVKVQKQKEDDWDIEE